MDFIKRNKFWIGIGLLVLVAGAAFGVLFVPVRASNSRKARDIRQKATSVAEYKSSPRIVNQQWVQQAEQSVEEWQEEIRQIGQQLETQDDLIEQIFKDPDNPGRSDPLEAGMWKMVYQEKVRALRQTARRAFKVLGSEALVTQDYGEEWPPPEEMRREERKYWIQKHIVDSLAALNEGAARPVVPVFDDFRFVERPERLVHPSHNSTFRPIAFEIRLGSTFPNVPLVLHALLGSEANCQITSFEVKRSNRAGERRNVAQAEQLQIEAPEVAEAEVQEQPRQPRGGVPTAPPSVVSGEEEGPPAWLMEQIMQGQVGGQPSGAPGRQERSRQERRPARAAQTRAEPTEEVELPENLVDITLKGYVLDYIEEQEQGQQSANQ